MKFNFKSEFKQLAFDIYADKLKKSGAYVELREIKMKRKLDQNALYWLWLTCIEKETGFKKDQLHVMYRASFLLKEESYILGMLKEKSFYRLKEIIVQFHYIPQLGEIIDYISRSTTELQVDEFARYLTSIKDHARENFNVILLNLDEKNFIEFYKEYYTN